MERFFEWSGITAVTISSMGLALLIEMALLKLIFRCLAHAKVDAAGDGASVTVGRQWVSGVPRTTGISREPSAAAVRDPRTRF